MVFWKQFILRCDSCGHRNCPHKSPRIGIRMVLTGEFNACRKCGKVVRKVVLSDRPLVREVRAELISHGITPVC
jgi:uncharacterized Zn finger protein